MSVIDTEDNESRHNDYPMPPSRDRGRVSMKEGRDESINDKLRKAVGMKSGAKPEEGDKSTKMITTAAELLVSAAKMKPEMKDAIQQCLTILATAAGSPPNSTAQPSGMGAGQNSPEAASQPPMPPQMSGGQGLM